MILIKWTKSSFATLLNLNTSLSLQGLEILKRNTNISVLEKESIAKAIDTTPENIRPIIHTIITDLINNQKLLSKHPENTMSINVGIFNHQEEKQPNKDTWISIYNRSLDDITVWELLKNGKTCHNCVHFTSDSEIYSLLNTLNSLSVNRKLTIISRFCNFNCETIKAIGKNFTNIEIFTTNVDRINKKSLQGIWERGFNVFLGNTGQIHERAIMIGDCLLIVFDDEFDKISKNYGTWTVTIFICKKTVTNKVKLKKDLKAIPFSVLN